MERVSGRVLVIDDDASMRFTLEAVLGDAGLERRDAPTVARRACRRSRRAAPTSSLTDLAMPEVDGMKVLERLRAQDPGVPVMMLTAHGSERVAVAAMKAGAFDYLPKPFDPDELVLAVQRGLETRALRLENARLRTRGLARPTHRRREPGHAARARHGRARRAQGRDRALHRRERRRQRRRRHDAARPLAARRQAAHPLQCRGHPQRARRGGALRPHQGRVHRRASGAARLLPAGRQGARSSSTRSASCRSPSRPSSCARFSRARCSRSAAAPRRSTCVWSRRPTAIWPPRSQAGRFREDLFYRLNVVPIRVPPLRERPEDIEPLVHCVRPHYAERYGMGPGRGRARARRRHEGARWPGNVRELENTVARLLALAPDDRLTLALWRSLDRADAPRRRRAPLATGDPGAEPPAARARRDLRAQRSSPSSSTSANKNQSETARRLGRVAPGADREAPQVRPHVSGASL